MTTTDSGTGTSALTLYSLAIVVTDKPDNTDMIEVTPIEQLPHNLGAVKDDKTNYNVTSPNAKGVTSNTNVIKDKTIIAKWYDISGGNRVTAPDVYKGETVLLLRFADADRFFWVNIGREPSLRKLETIMYAASNVRGQGSYDKNTSYWVEVSTKNKYIHLHTSNNDKEPFTYDIKIDTGQGMVTFTDSNTNSITIDSKNNLMTIDMDVLIKRTLTVDGDVTNHSNVQTDKNTNIDGTLDVTQLTTLKGGLNVSGGGGGGACNITGNMNMQGNIGMQGNVNVDGNISSTGPVSAPNV